MPLLDDELTACELRASAIKDEHSLALIAQARRLVNALPAEVKNLLPIPAVPEQTELALAPPAPEDSRVFFDSYAPPDPARQLRDNEKLYDPSEQQFNP